MEFLKAILGDELYKQVEASIAKFNGDAANKDKQIKIGNLGTGEYVGKGKYDALQAQFDGQKTELDKASGLIEELKKGTKNDSALQGKITEYETQVSTLQAELAKAKLDNAIQLALRDAKAADPDYLAYKLHEKYTGADAIALDDAGKIKGWDDKLAGLKTQFPAQFTGAGGVTVIEKKLPNNPPPAGSAEPKSLEEALKMAYAPKNEQT